MLVDSHEYGRYLGSEIYITSTEVLVQTQNRTKCELYCQKKKLSESSMKNQRMHSDRIKISRHFAYFSEANFIIHHRCFSFLGSECNIDFRIFQLNSSKNGFFAKR